MSIANHGLTPPLDFGLSQSVRFDRPVDPARDSISPGGYELRMRDGNGAERVVAFNFESFVGNVDESDPCVVHCMQRTPDLVAFEGARTITEPMLRNVVEVLEWNIATDGPYEDDESFLHPVAVTDAEFVIFGDAATRQPLDIRIPLDIPITPSCY